MAAHVGRVRHLADERPGHRDGASLPSVAIDWTIVGVGDFNGDGKADILWRHTSGARLRVADERHQCHRHGVAGSAGNRLDRLPRLGDFNGDGKADILWRHTSGVVYVWLLDSTAVIGTESPGSAGTDWQIQ